MFILSKPALDLENDVSEFLLISQGSVQSNAGFLSYFCLYTANWFL